MSQFAEPVIPDESAYADEIRNPVKVQYNQILSGSRLASAAAGLGRDDELLLKERENELGHFLDNPVCSLFMRYMSAVWNK